MVLELARVGPHSPMPIAFPVADFFQMVAQGATRDPLGAPLAAARPALPELEASAANAAAALAAALSIVDRDIAAAHDERARLAAGCDAESLALYEQVRARMTSAAVAEIVKGSCGGCRTALSPKEQAELKKVADMPDARCPYCSCLLVV